MMKDDANNNWVHICSRDGRYTPFFQVVRSPSSICPRCRVGIDLLLKEEEIVSLEKMVDDSADRFQSFHEEHLDPLDVKSDED